MALVNGGELIVRALKHEGIENVFALSGGHLDPIFQACKDHGIRLIDTRHEAAAAHMADGYARTTGKPSVAIATAGPGVTNALTGVANAWMDAVPLVCIGGRSPLRDEDRLPLQSMDQIALMEPITKFARTIYQPERIPEYIASAFRHAVSGRPGPVFLDIPIDVLFTPIDDEALRPIENFAPEGRPAPSQASIDAALSALEQAERPAIFAGGGVLFSGASAELQEFAEIAQIPVFANAKARGAVPEDGALSFNSFALAASPGAHAAGGGPPDVIMLLGARVGMNTGSSGGRRSMIPDECTLIQVDIEAEEIGRNRDVQIGLVGDIREALKLFLEGAKERRFKDHANWLSGLAEAAATTRDLHGGDMDREGPIHQARLAREIADLMRDEVVIVADGGETSQWMAGQAVVDGPGRFLSHGYLGCLGVGIPFGLAAKIAWPERRVLTIIGDGSAGLNIAEFDTAVRHDIPLVVVVNNDQGWGMIRHGQVEAYGEDNVVGAELGPVRYDLAAAGFGAHAELVTDRQEVGPALERAFASGKPACLNVMTDPKQPFAAPRPAAKKEPVAAPPKKDGEVELPYYGKRKLK